MTITERRVAAAAKKRAARLKKLGVLNKQREHAERAVELLNHKYSTAVSKLRVKLGVIRARIAAV